MSTVRIGVFTEADMRRRMALSFRGRRQGEWIAFSSVELLWKVMTPRRRELVQAMAGRGPMSVRGVARLVEWDVKNIGTDVQGLLQYGVLKKTTAGDIEFPYDALHVDFMIEKVS